MLTGHVRAPARGLIRQVIAIKSQSSDLGLSEEEVIGKIVSVTAQVIDQSARPGDALLANSPASTRKPGKRTYGLLTHSV